MSVQGKIDKLANQMKQLAVQPSTSKGKKKKGGAVAGATPAAVSVPVIISASSSKGGRRRRRGAAGAGSIVISRKELLAAITLPATTTEKSDKFVLAPSSFTWLSTLAKSFEDYQWQSLRVWWRPAVGTSTSGMVAIGMDWNFSSKGNNKPPRLENADAPTRAQVVGLTPSMDCAIWQDTTGRPLTLPSSLMRTRRWFILGSATTDLAPGQLVYSVVSDAAPTGGKFLGEIWCSYSVRLFGTNTV